MQTAGRLGRLLTDVQEWGIHRISALRRRSTASHLETGLLGERAALFELTRRGYLVVARRWTNPRAPGDIDLIAWTGDQLCFIEVKTRTARDMAPAEAAVDEHKRKTLRRLARLYLRTFPENVRGTIAIRFDVISVYLIDGRPQFEVFPKAFGWE